MSSSTMLPSAEWVSPNSRRQTVRSRLSSSISMPTSPHLGGTAAAAAAAAGTMRVCGGDHDDEDHHGVIAAHRGSGGLVRGRAVFCLPPGVEWFQGHFAYAARGGCTASLGVLGTELPVDPCMQCCHGGFSRYKLVFIHHESGMESTLIVERYGGNMMSLHAEPSREGEPGGDRPEASESELTFQTHTMKADDDARPLLDRYFQSVVRAAANPAELRECIVCIGQMDVPLSLLQELAAPLPDGSRTQSMVCSAFAPCRETPPHQSRPTRSKATPVLSPYPRQGVATDGNGSSAPALSREQYRRQEGGGGGAARQPGGGVGGGATSVGRIGGGGGGGGGGGEGRGRGEEEDDEWL